MTHKLVEPGDDARAAERVVALIMRYAVRFAPVDRITFYSVIVLCAVSHHARSMPDVLLRFHRSECVAEAFILYDSGVAYALVFAEDAIGKQVTFPSNLQGLVDEVIDLDILPRQLLRYLATF